MLGGGGGGGAGGVQHRVEPLAGAVGTHHRLVILLTCSCECISIAPSRRMLEMFSSTVYFFFKFDQKK